LPNCSFLNQLRKEQQSSVDEDTGGEDSEHDFGSAAGRKNAHAQQLQRQQRVARGAVFQDFEVVLSKRKKYFKPPKQNTRDPTKRPLHMSDVVWQAVQASEHQDRGSVAHVEAPKSTVPPPPSANELLAAAGADLDWIEHRNGRASRRLGGSSNEDNSSSATDGEAVVQDSGSAEASPDNEFGVGAADSIDLLSQQLDASIELALKMEARDGRYPPQAVADVTALVKAAIRYAARERRSERPGLPASTAGQNGKSGEASSEIPGRGSPSALSPPPSQDNPNHTTNGPSWSLTLDPNDHGDNATAAGSVAEASFSASEDDEPNSSGSLGEFFGSASGLLSGGGRGLRSGSNSRPGSREKLDGALVEVDALAALVHGKQSAPATPKLDAISSYHTSDPNINGSVVEDMSRPSSSSSSGAVLESGINDGGNLAMGMGSTVSMVSSGNGPLLSGNNTLTMGRSSSRAARAVSEALAKISWTIPEVFEAHYLDQWHQSSTDMFLRVDSKGPPPRVDATLAVDLLLNAMTQSEREAEQLRRRTLLLRRRRIAATARQASQRWLGTKDPLPLSQVMPEYLDPSECDEVSLQRASISDDLLLAPNRSPQRSFELEGTDATSDLGATRRALSRNSSSRVPAVDGGAVAEESLKGDTLEVLQETLIENQNNTATAVAVAPRNEDGSDVTLQVSSAEAPSVLLEEESPFNSSSRHESFTLSFDGDSTLKSTSSSDTEVLVRADSIRLNNDEEVELVRPVKPKLAFTGYKKQQAAAEEKVRQSKFESKRYPAFAREATSK